MAQTSNGATAVPVEFSDSDLWPTPPQPRPSAGAAPSRLTRPTAPAAAAPTPVAVPVAKTVDEYEAPPAGFVPLPTVQQPNVLLGKLDDHVRSRANTVGWGIVVGAFALFGLLFLTGALALVPLVLLGMILLAFGRPIQWAIRTAIETALGLRVWVKAAFLILAVYGLVCTSGLLWQLIATVSFMYLFLHALLLDVKEAKAASTLNRVSVVEMHE